MGFLIVFNSRNYGNKQLRRFEKKRLWLSANPYYRKNGALIAVIVNFCSNFEYQSKWKMKRLDRELLILLPEDRYNDVALEQEAVHLHHLLNKVDTLEFTASVVEFLNIHRGGFIKNPLRIKNALRNPVLGSFQFIIHKN